MKAPLSINPEQTSGLSLGKVEGLNSEPSEKETLSHDLLFNGANVKNSIQQKKGTALPVDRIRWAVKNPFEEFKIFTYKRSELPLDRIVRSTEEVMDRIQWGYEKLLEEEAKELVWMVQYNTIIKAYEVAEKYIKEIDYSAEDVEDFCFALENTQKIPYLIPGPAGIYISALCNYAPEEEIVLKLSELKTEINLIGFRLPKGKRMVIEGDTGDFTGIGLEGGELVVEGNAKNWTGAGMRSGRILVRKNIGLHTGEWMMGGEIYVGGRVRGLGNIVEGKVFEKDKLVYPGKTRQPHLYY